jgi:hypothetical protein
MHATRLPDDKPVSVPVTATDVRTLLADAMACRPFNYTDLKRVCVPILFWVCVPRIPCVRNMGALGIRPGAPALKPVILACFALISRPYKRSNRHPRTIKWADNSLASA